MSSAHWTRAGALAGLVLLMIFAATVLRDAWPHRAQAADAAFNDSWATRETVYSAFPYGPEVFPLERTVSNVGATLEPGESASCAPTGATVWLELQIDRTGVLELRSVDVTFNPVVALFKVESSGTFLPSPPGGNMVEVACDTAVGPTRIEVPVTAGDFLYVQVGGVNGSQGTLRLLGECRCAPPNDPYASYVELYLDGNQQETVVEQSTNNATLEDGEQRLCANVGATVWFRMYAAQPRRVRLDPAGSDFPTVITVFDAREYPTAPASITPLQCVADNNRPLIFDAEVGREYWVQVGGVDGATGRLSLKAACDPACPPYNDRLDFGSYISVYEPPYGDYINTAGATIDAGERRPCGNIGKTVWYAFTSRGGTTLTVDSAGSDFPVVLAAYEQVSVSPPPGGFDEIACEAGSLADQPRLSFDVEANATYWVQAGGVGGAGGNLSVNVDCEPQPCPPWNDSRFSVEGFEVPGTLPLMREQETDNATVEDGEPLDCGDMSATVWYSIFAWPADTDIVIDTAGSEYDTAIAVYRVGSQENFGLYEQIGCAEGGDGERARLELTAPVDTQLLLQIGSRGESGGLLRLNVNCAEYCPPVNDNIASALDVFGLNFLFEQRDTRGATLEADEPVQCGLEGNLTNTVWYRFRSNWDAELQVSAEGSDYHTAIGVYFVDWSAMSPPGGLTPAACNRIDEPSKFTFEVEPDRDYYVQVGSVGVSAGGLLALEIKCIDDCPPDYYGQPVTDGVISGPDTGSGGYR